MSSNSSAHPQGGVFEGLNPAEYNASDPVVLFIIQAALVMALTQLLHWPLSKIREPRVIAEVLAGVILGPSVMGRIPGFTATIFPDESMPPFRLAANIGLILFLFIVGLETDLRFLVRNWRAATAVATMSMVIPFGLGVAVAYGLYHDKDKLGLKPATFPVFALFIGVAMAITAFPVLCRILTSLKLLGTPVGVVVLTSGIANDVVGWVLLALCVTLVNATSGLTALWIFLSAAGFALFLSLLVRPTFVWLLRRTRSLEQGPTQGIVALTIFMVLAAAFFTNVIGVHAIFGAFMVGLMCPHEGGFAIKLTEKIEDLMSTLFIPLFFALSGLNTNLGLLDDGRTWGFVVAITAVAFFSKVLGGMLGARFTGMVWRESAAIGALMSCKGLVELIVLNIGLQSQIISFKTFTMFVVMALVTTFATAPLVSWLYPPAYREKLDLWKNGLINWDGTPVVSQDVPPQAEVELDGRIFHRAFISVLPGTLPSLLQIVPLLTQSFEGRPRLDDGERNEGREEAAQSPSPTRPQPAPVRPLQVHICHFRNLGERDSSWMKVADSSEYSRRDIVLQSFSSALISTSQHLRLSGKSTFVAEEALAEAVVTEASKQQADFVLLPWSGRTILPHPASSAPGPSQSDPGQQNGEQSTFFQSVFAAAHGQFAVAVHHHSGMSEIDNEKSPVLQRTVSRRSTADDVDTGVVQYAQSGLTGVFSVKAIYSGTEDDLFALQLAWQIVEARGVDLRVFVAPHGHNEANALAFSALQQRISESDLARRVSFENIGPSGTQNQTLFTAAAAAEGPVGTVEHSPGDSARTLYILGRSVLGHPGNNASTPVSELEKSGPKGKGAAEVPEGSVVAGDGLGKMPQAVMARVRDLGHRNASFLIVQEQS